MPLLIKRKLLPPEAFASYAHAPLSPVKHTALHTGTYITVIKHAAWVHSACNHRRTAAYGNNNIITCTNRNNDVADATFSVYLTLMKL